MMHMTMEKKSMNNYSVEDAINNNVPDDLRRRVESEVLCFVQSLSSQVEPIGKDLISTLDSLIQALGNQSDGKEVDEKSIRFIPNDRFLNLDPADLGYFTISNVCPSDLQLDLITPISSIETGSKVKCSISCVKDMPTVIFQFLKCTVSLYPEVHFPVEVGPSGLDFSFDLPVPGRYLVAVKLYDQHIDDSPMLLPVSDCALSTLSKIGLTSIESEAVKSENLKLFPGSAGDDKYDEDLTLAKTKKSVSSEDVVMKPTLTAATCNQIKWTVGSPCIAKWSEDSVWYRGKIENIGDDSTCTVSFIDYGNSDIVKIDSLVDTVEGIPSSDKDIGMIDEFVNRLPAIQEETHDVSTYQLGSPEEKFKIVEGQICIAKWPEDDVWYNARVDQIFDHDRISVTFTDYGNSEEIPYKNLISCFNDIPSEEIDFVDEHVLKCNEVSSQIDASTVRFEIGCNSANMAENEESEPQINQLNEDDINKEILRRLNTSVKVNEPKVTNILELNSVEKGSSGTSLDTVRLCDSSSTKKGLAEGDKCIAKWKEDGVWYNAAIKEVTDLSVVVEFTDYGNEEVVALESIVNKATDIPKDAEIDTYVLKQENMHQSDEASSSSKQTSESQTRNISVGDLCIAQWQEDSIWYNVEVVNISDTDATVKFVDYGNEDVVALSKIVIVYEDIPTDADVDCNVLKGVSHGTGAAIEEDLSSITKGIGNLDIKRDGQEKLKNGDACVALWQEDGVWYNGIIAELNVDRALVHFTDYGNEDYIKMDSILLNREDIPKDSEVDINVHNLSRSKNHEVMIRSGDKCVALWQEDGVWYNATVLEVINERALIQFTDYGNEDMVKISSILTNPKNIPKDAEIDQYVLNSNKKSDEKALKIGDKCVALWHEDGVWYNATIKEICDDVALVHFTDYGNEDHVKRTSILLKASTIPEDADIDPNVLDHLNSLRECGGALKIGDTCVAMWQEDGVWYNATIKEISETAALVHFTDYGNEDHIKIDSILLNPLDIPKDAEIDVHVNGSTQVSVDPSEKIRKSNLCRGDVCIAKWHEDEVWYNARILEIRPASAMVIFTDYENEDEVKLSNIVSSSSLIPCDDEIDCNVRLKEIN